MFEMFKKFGAPKSNAAPASDFLKGRPLLKRGQIDMSELKHRFAGNTARDPFYANAVKRPRPAAAARRLTAQTRPSAADLRSGL